MQNGCILTYYFCPKIKRTMANEIDYTRKCQQLDVLIDLLERENKRLREMIVRCGECRYFGEKSKLFTSRHCCSVMGMNMKAEDFCSYGEREVTE